METEYPSWMDAHTDEEVAYLFDRYRKKINGSRTTFDKSDVRETSVRVDNNVAARATWHHVMGKDSVGAHYIRNGHIDFYREGFYIQIEADYLTHARDYGRSYIGYVLFFVEGGKRVARKLFSWPLEMFDGMKLVEDGSRRYYRVNPSV